MVQSPQTYTRAQSSNPKQSNTYPYNARPLPYSTSGNIIQQTRQLSDSVVATLMDLAKNKKASKYIKKIIDSSDCVNSLEAAIVSIEAGTKLIENAGPELLNLVGTVENMEDKKDIPTLVRDSAHVLRQLEILVPKIAPENP